MKAIIDKVKFKKEVDSKFGKRYIFEVTYNSKEATYFSTKQEQSQFIEGQEAEFTEESHESGGRVYLNVKPINKFNRHVKREQTKYSGFAVSYCKDLIIAGKLEMKDWKKASKEIFDFMVELDKNIND